MCVECGLYVAGHMCGICAVLCVAYRSHAWVYMYLVICMCCGLYVAGHTYGVCVPEAHVAYVCCMVHVNIITCFVCVYLVTHALNIYMVMCVVCVLHICMWCVYIYLFMCVIFMCLSCVVGFMRCGMYGIHVSGDTCACVCEADSTVLFISLIHYFCASIWCPM